MANKSTPFYNPDISYEENYVAGPFGVFADHAQYSTDQKPQVDFLGHKVHLPFGIPAGPLLNANFIQAAFNYGYNLCVYKTVRSRQYPCHPWPNVLAIHEDKLEINRTEPVVADHNYTQPLSITNSFGVPSADPKVWQPDMARAVESAHPGQLLIASFQGTNTGEGKAAFIADYVAAAKLVKSTGALIWEANLSCPNEGTANLLCYDTEAVYEIVSRIKDFDSSTPLLIKLAYFSDQHQLEQLIQRVGSIVDGFATINTISASVVDQNRQQALPGSGRERSGICGHAIKWAGLDMVKRLIALRTENNLKYTVIGVGGVTSPADYHEYRQLGADAIMSATGAMWNPLLAKEISQNTSG